MAETSPSEEQHAEDLLRLELEAAALEQLHAASRRLRQEVERDWPLLSYYFGIPPSELAQLPRWLRLTYVKGLTQIRARERLSAIEDLSVPYMERGDRDCIVRRLKRLAGYVEPPATRPQSLEEMQGGLAGMGINVEVVKRDA